MKSAVVTALIFTGIAASPSGPRAQNRDAYGVWASDTRQDLTAFPYKGIVVDFKWADIKDSFFSGKPLSGAYPVTLRVVYYDEGSAQWSLRYDAVNEPAKTACRVMKTNSHTWKERTVTLPDAYFGNRGPRGADLSLVNPDAEDDIFHMVELTREIPRR